MLQSAGGSSAAGIAVFSKFSNAKRECGNFRRSLLQKEKDMAAITAALEREREEMAGTVPGTRDAVIALANGVYPVSSCVA
jgi:hypothetical protein